MDEMDNKEQKWLIFALRSNTKNARVVFFNTIYIAFLLAFRKRLCYYLQITVSLPLEQKGLAAYNAPSGKGKFNTPFYHYHLI
jgi:hypothetical protein